MNMFEELIILIPIVGSIGIYDEAQISQKLNSGLSLIESALKLQLGSWLKVFDGGGVRASPFPVLR